MVQQLPIARVFLLRHRVFLVLRVRLVAFFEDDVQAVHAADPAQKAVAFAVEGDSEPIRERLPRAVVVLVGRAENAIQIEDNALILHRDFLLSVNADFRCLRAVGAGGGIHCEHNLDKTGLYAIEINADAIARRGVELVLRGGCDFGKVLADLADENGDFLNARLPDGGWIQADRDGRDGMRLAQHDEHFRRESFAFPVGIGFAVVDVSADVHVGMRAGNDFLIEREILRFGEGDVLVSGVREARRALRLGLVGRGNNGHDGGDFFFRLRQKGQARQRQGEHGGYDRTHFHERNFLSIMMVGVVMRVVGRAHLARQCASGR